MIHLLRESHGLCQHTEVGFQAPRVADGRGAPKYHVTREQLELLLNSGFSIAHIHRY